MQIFYDMRSEALLRRISTTIVFINHSNQLD